VVAHRLSFIVRAWVRPCVNNFLKQILLLNDKFVETLQECPLHEALPTLFKQLRTMVAMATERCFFNHKKSSFQKPQDEEPW